MDLSKIITEQHLKFNNYLSFLKIAYISID